MAYKRNPMRAERMCSLARYVISLQSSTAQTVATQWMERTLDDSANRRLVLPQAFLAIDAILILYQNIASGLAVYPQVIARNLREELPFMATREHPDGGVAAGGDRQELHERDPAAQPGGRRGGEAGRPAERPARTAGRPIRRSPRSISRPRSTPPSSSAALRSRSTSSSRRSWNRSAPATGVSPRWRRKSTSDAHPRPWVCQIPMHRTDSIYNSAAII